MLAGRFRSDDQQKACFLKAGAGGRRVHSGDASRRSEEAGKSSSVSTPQKVPLRHTSSSVVRLPFSSPNWLR
jgi:hypothetical protein